MKMVVLCAATLWVTAKNAPFSDRNKSFQTFLKTFEIASLNQNESSAVPILPAPQSQTFRRSGSDFQTSITLPPCR